MASVSMGDQGLKHLAGLTRLEGLDLRGTKVGDAGLKHLTGLMRLETIDLRNTKATDDGIKALQAVLPRVDIVNARGVWCPRASDRPKGIPAK